jgi:tRNA A-37 threonylcarbamoyl transferase component Bud32
VAELVVKSRCKSSLRQLFDGTLNLSFPIWGVVSPVAIIVCLTMLIGSFISHTHNQIWAMIVFIGILACFTLVCLFLKRALANDVIIVNKDGIKLPWLLGAVTHLNEFIAWNAIKRIDALIERKDLNRSTILIHRHRGHTAYLAIKFLQPEFVEQFLLAAKMWAPKSCDTTLDELQATLRLDAQKSNQLSYTDLWEDELGRRFCPTAYVTLEPGHRLRDNTLRVLNHLASGGLSALYLCQINGNKLVVLKEAAIPPHGAENIKLKAKEMFSREGMLLTKIDHPNIVHVLDCFTENDRSYLILEYVNGTDLRQLVHQSGPQSESDVLDWAIQIATALKYLHEREQPIIHRDLTPDNMVLRNDGKVILVDFGAANEFIGTATGTFVGKHSFIAPEQLRGKATVQSDIYAFGCSLYFLLVGSEPEALSESNPRANLPSVNEELSELVQSCTRLELSERYQSIAQLLPVLRRLAAHSLVI